MALSSFLIFLNISVFLSALVIGSQALPVRALPVGRWLMLLVFCFCLISFCTLNVYAQHRLENKIFFSWMRYYGFALIPPSWLLFVSAYSRSWLWLQRPWVRLVLFAPPLATLVIVTLPALRPWMVDGFEPLHLAGIEVLKFRTGPWFTVHFLWGSILVAASWILMASVFFTANRIRRRQILLLVLGGSLSYFVDLYCVVSGTELRWLMISTATFGLTEFAISYASLRHRLLNPLAMEKIYFDFPDPVLVIDAEGFLRSYNHSASRVFSLSPSHLFHSLSGAIPALDLTSREYVHGFSDEEKRVFELHVEEILHHGDLAGRLLCFHEITARKQAELHLGRELEFRARLMSIIAHDLSGHVHGQARLSAELRKNVPPDQRSLAEVLTQSIWASRDLMGNLLTWAKTQESSFVPVIRPLELNTLLEDVLHEVDALARLQNIRLELRSDARPLLFNGDSEMLGSVVRNLLTNSIRASRAGQEVLLCLEKSDLQVFLRVVDQGIGLSPAQIQNLFSTQPLLPRDGEEGQTRAQGYGVGLTLARRFVELHRGQLGVSSIPGRETCFTVTLPL